MILHIDLETRSTLELPEVGVHKYATGEHTDVWCMGWAFDDEEPAIWTPGVAPWPAIIHHVRAGGLVTAHNAAFELQIWNHILVPRYGWPVLKPSQVRCSMACCYAMALPGSLEKAAAAVGIQQQKDLKGGRLMLQMSRPKGFDLLGDPIWWDDEDKRQSLYEYCKQDVRVEQALGARLLPLSPDEQALWELDYAINERGLYLDQPAIVSAMAIIEREQRRLEGEIRRRTESAVGSPAEVAALTRWVRDQGVVLDGLAKSDVVELLHRDELPAHVRAVLRIRQEYAKTSTAKLNRMRDAASADGRIRFTMQYHGAGTGRWAGRRIQPQNLPRSTVSHEAIEEMLEYLPTTTPERAIEWLDLYYGEPMSMISNCLRGLICAAPGKTLVAGDFSNIEGRVLAWLAGEEWKLNAFRDFDAGVGPDIYKLSYSKSFGVPVSDITKDQRQIGKVMELACFGGETQVLTDNGVKPILEVTTEDKVWDGHEWVRHRGLVYQGTKRVIDLAGVEVTPDHLIKTGRTWKRAEQLAMSGSTRCRALATGSENLPSWPTGSGQPEDHRPWCGFSVRVAPRGTKSMTTTSAMKKVRGATSARRSSLPIGERIFGATQISSRVTTTGGGSLIASRPVLTDVTTRRIGDTQTTEDGAFEYMNPGEQTAARFSPTSWGLTGGTKRIWNWIERMWTRAMSRGTCSLSRGMRTQGIEERSERCSGTFSNWRPVYDLVLAGPRNQFTIITDDGPLLVHNCGYQGGVGAFQTMARGYGVKVTDERANEIKTLWRDSHPRVVSYWWDLERAALEAVAHPGAKVTVRQTAFIVKGSFLFAKLPSGRMLTYPYPVLKAIETPWGEMKEQLHYWHVDGLTNKWEETHTYGGKLAENLTQAVARDVLAEAITRVSQWGFDVVLHVHDEIVAEMRWEPDWLEYLVTQMKVLPAWATGLPVAAEGWQGRRYRK